MLIRNTMTKIVATMEAKIIHIAMLYRYRNEANVDENLWAGLLCIVFFFLIISVIAFPNGPFTRPHPAFWRILFGCSVLYLLALQFMMFQNYPTIRSIFYWIDPKLKNFHIDMEKVRKCLSVDELFISTIVFLLLRNMALIARTSVGIA